MNNKNIKLVRNYRIPCASLQNNKGEAETREIVFKSQVNAIHKYFTLLHNIFGKDNGVRSILKNLPHQKHLTQQYYQSVSKIDSSNLSEAEHLDNERTSHCSKRKQVQIYKEAAKDCESYRLVLRGSLIHRSKKNSMKGQILKGSAASKHMCLMHKLQQPSSQTLYAQSSLGRTSDLEEEYSENFIPLGKKVQKHDLTGAVFQDERDNIKLSRIRQKQLKYRTQYIENRKIKRKMTTETSSIVGKVVPSFSKHLKKQNFPVKKMSTPHAQSSRERQFSPWDLQSTFF